MATRIKILPQELANKIAAGEVIERPASVVKELVENAIDAESTHIVISVKVGGAQLISVEDNGMGMGAEDAVVALSRHATSKIADIADLDSIGTLGFRGEALPSIGAVSRLELSTREEGSMSGTAVIMEGGKVITVEETGRAVGTTVTVKRLFYNTPARRKFLRSASTELRHITRTMGNYAIAHPQIGFVLHHNDREILRWPRTDSLKGRLQDIYGPQLLKDALLLDYSSEGCVVSGWIGRPETARTSRIHQFIFLNERPIVSHVLYHAIFEGYEPLLPKGRYPFAVVMIAMDRGRVDVNVHPTKREVRFADERSVHRAVVSAVRAALGEKKAAPQWSPPPSRRDLRREIAARFPFTEPSIQSDVRVSLPPQTGQGAGEGQLSFSSMDGERREKSGDVLPEENVALWQLHRRYVLAQIRDGAVIIDQHAAHERVLYEKAKKSFRGERGTGQQLLFPLTMELSPEEMALMSEALPLFEQLGFSIKPFGGTTVVVEAVPSIVRSGTGERVIVEILDSLIETGSTGADIRDRVAISYACKTAIKDGDQLSQEEMNHLITALFATQNPYCCPHGRPTFIRLPLFDLDKKFKR